MANHQGRRHQSGVNRQTRSDYGLEGRHETSPPTFCILPWAAVALRPIADRKGAIYPIRPVRFVVGFPASDASDIVARLMAQSLSDRFGSSSSLRTVQAPPAISAPSGRASGSGRLYASSGRPSAIYQRDALPEPQFQFHPRHRTGREHCTRLFVMVVNPSVPAKTVPEFIAYAKANPGKINYGLGR